MTTLDINFNLIDVKYHTSFNGTTIHYKDNRYICIYHNSVNHGIASCFLDYNNGKYHYVEGTTHNMGETGFIDTRIIKYNNEYFISNTNFLLTTQNINLRRLKVHDTKIEIDNSQILGFPTIYNFDGYTNRTEKNWCPFEHDGKFYYVYSLNPHRILEVDIYGTGEATLKYNTSWYTNSWWSQQNWEGPYFRLNSPPIKLSDNTYLSTFHTMNFSRVDSKVNKNVPGNIRCYWIGFYQFEGHPPFKVLKISKVPVFTANYEMPTNWPRQSMRIFSANPFFPFNLFLDEKNLVMTGGSNDVALACCSVQLEKILQSLEYVNCF